MTALKFRAWWTGLKKMMTDFRISADGRIFSAAGNELFIPSDVIVMQSTGIRDKHGRELFEGDVITAWSQGYQHKGEVRWRAAENGGGCPCYIIYPAFADGHFWHLNGGKDQSDVEIIGNIYENPDLVPSAA